MKYLQQSFLFFILILFGSNNLFASENFIDFSQRDPFKSSKIKFIKDTSKISYKRYTYIVTQDPLKLKNILLTKVKIKKMMNMVASKDYSNKKMDKWLTEIVKNQYFQKACYYLFFNKGIYLFKNKKITLPNFDKGFKNLSQAILQTDNPIASFIGSYFLLYYFNNNNNPVFKKYAKIFAESLYKTKKSCLADYIYGDYFTYNIEDKNYKLAHKILFNGYKKCKKKEHIKGTPHLVIWQMKILSAKIGALLAINAQKGLR